MPRPIGKRKLSYGSMSESCEDDCLDIAIEKGEIVKCIRKLKKGERMDLVGELLKYGGSGMVCLLEQLSGMRKQFLGNGERALLLIFLRKMIGENPGNYRGITLLSVVGRVSSR